MIVYDWRHRLLAENKNIKNFQNAEGVHDKKRDKPRLASLTPSLPERQPFPNNRPHESQNNDEDAETRNPRRYACAQIILPIIHKISILFRPFRVVELREVPFRSLCEPLEVSLPDFPVVEVRLGSFLFASQTNRTFTTGFTLLSFSEKNFGGFARPSFLKENFGGFALLGFSPKNLGLLRPTTPQSPTCAQESLSVLRDP